MESSEKNRTNDSNSTYSTSPPAVPPCTTSHDRASAASGLISEKPNPPAPRQIRESKKIDYYRNPANSANVHGYPICHSMASKAYGLPPANSGTASELSPQHVFESSFRLDSMEKMFNSLKSDMARASDSKELLEKENQRLSTRLATMEAELAIRAEFMEEIFLSLRVAMEKAEKLREEELT